MLALGLPSGFADPGPGFFALEFDRLGSGALDLEFSRGVRGFELLRDAIVEEGRDGLPLGGVGGLPVEGVGADVLKEEVFSRGFLNIAPAGLLSICARLDVGCNALQQPSNGHLQMRRSIRYNIRETPTIVAIMYTKEIGAEVVACSIN